MTLTQGHIKVKVTAPKLLSDPYLCTVMLDLDDILHKHVMTLKLVRTPLNNLLRGF